MKGSSTGSSEEPVLYWPPHGERSFGNLLEHQKGTDNATEKAKERNAAADNAAVIRLAVEYAQAVAAGHGGFKADPGGNSTTAAKGGEKYWEQAELALQKLAARPATSAEALDAKARVVPIALDHDDDLSKPADKFFRSFAADVSAFLKDAVHKEWIAKKDQAA